MSEHDMPDDIAAMLRDVPPADDTVREAHISAALDVIESVPSGNVVRLGPRTALRFVAAAAVAAVLGAGIGWSARGGDNQPLAEVATDAARNATMTTVKGSLRTSCDFSGLQDSAWLGEYEMDGRHYGLFVNNWSVVWYDLDTCGQVQDIPHPTTTAP